MDVILFFVVCRRIGNEVYVATYKLMYYFGGGYGSFLFIFCIILKYFMYDVLLKSVIVSVYGYLLVKIIILFMVIMKREFTVRFNKFDIFFFFVGFRLFLFIVVFDVVFLMCVFYFCLCVLLFYCLCVLIIVCVFVCCVVFSFVCAFRAFARVFF